MGLLSFTNAEFNSGYSQQEPQGSQNSITTDPAIRYINTAKNLLNQVSTEYHQANYTGAEELAIRAYLDNFEYAEAALQKNGAVDLMEQLEGMMNKEIRGMIKKHISVEELDSKINTTDAKLEEAITVLSEASSQ